MAGPITKCRRKDAMGNHYIHQDRFDGNWWNPKRVSMCNSRGRFEPIADAHRKPPAPPRSKRQ